MISNASLWKDSPYHHFSSLLAKGSCPTYAKTKAFTPLLNREDVSNIFGGEDGNSVPTDSQGLVRSLETVLFSNTVLKVLSLAKYPILQVETSEYPYPGTFFVDARFLEVCSDDKEDFFLKRAIPNCSSSDIVRTLSSLIGQRYLWGGNCQKIPEMLTFYPPKKPFQQLEDETMNNWMLRGFDCSGLMYYATSGKTPRNTSSWITFGTGLPIEGKSLEDILSLLQPLDAIVWKGHVLFVFDQENTIESLLGKGVIYTPIKQRLEALLKERVCKNHWEEEGKPLLIRRWLPLS